jgi:aerobic carbon-monoxide dehydrogenase medium subunit
VIPAPVEYTRATTIAHALEALGRPDAKVLAGGQSLVPILKLRLARPSLLVDIGRLDLAGISLNGELRLGALTTWAALARAEELRRARFAALGECAAGIGDLQVRNLGTLGGGLAHADPASDMPAVMLALGASLLLRSSAGERRVAASDFFRGPFTTELGEQELLIEVLVPTPPERSGSAYIAIEHPASGFALAGAAALAVLDGEQVGSCSVAVTGLTGSPFLLPADALDEPETALAEIDLLDDRAAPADYRRALGAAVVRRAVARATSRARGDEP